ncbi:GNAT family N-acetyltransferase [Actinoplanes sp. NPDC023801]|uniref:GNAT family N-acetyltransferase n=1 Tax=Actinoplanes sp. NPDC023801 TaxID=3154595 RepID=UPI0033C457DC
MTTIVPLTSAHPAFDQVAALFDEYRVHHGRLPAPEDTRSWLHDQLAQRRLTAAAAVQGEHVHGFVTVAILPASLMLGTVWSIRDLYVAPPHRRGGVANALLRYVISDARAARAQRVSLQTDTGNVPALTLYAKAGFQRVTGLEILNLRLDPARPDPAA